MGKILMSKTVKNEHINSKKNTPKSINMSTFFWVPTSWPTQPYYSFELQEQALRVINKHTSRSNHIWKHVFHGQVHLRAGLPALPFSYCFGVTLHLEESPALRVTNYYSSLGRISCSASYFKVKLKKLEFWLLTLKKRNQACLFPEKKHPVSRLTPVQDELPWCPRFRPQQVFVENSNLRGTNMKVQ